MQEEAQRPSKKAAHSSYMHGKVRVTPDSTTTAATANQANKKAPKQSKPSKKPAKKKAKKPVAKSFKQLGNNPYASVPVKSNSMMKAHNVSPSSGFSFPGAV